MQHFDELTHEFYVAARPIKHRQLDQLMAQIDAEVDALIEKLDAELGNWDDLLLQILSAGENSSHE